MTVNLLVITHNDIGRALVDSATIMLGVSPMKIDVISINKTDSPEDMSIKAEELIDNNEATLVLTDMYGSTPSNIACRLHDRSGVRVVGGINLPMLVRVMNYPRLSLNELVEKAISGGRDGVLTCDTDSRND